MGDGSPLAPRVRPLRSWVIDGTSGLGARRAAGAYSASDRATAAEPRRVRGAGVARRAATPTRGPAAAASASTGSPPAARRTPGRARTWCSCRRRWSTGRGPTTRCRSPRMRRCGPTSEFAYAVQLGAAEQLVDDWRLAVPGPHASPCCARAWRWPPTAPRLAGALAAGMGRWARTTRPRSSCTSTTWRPPCLAAERRLDGVFNVAPDGWIAGRTGAGAGRAPAPAAAARPPRRGGRQAALAVPARPHPAGPAPLHPLAVAGGQRPAAGRGLAPTVTNEQAYVEGTEAKWWTMVTPKRRQELALGGSVVGVPAGPRGGHRRASVRRARRARRAEPRAAGQSAGRAAASTTSIVSSCAGAADRRRRPCRPAGRRRSARATGVIVDRLDAVDRHDQVADLSPAAAAGPSVDR